MNQQLKKVKHPWFLAKAKRPVERHGLTYTKGQLVLHNDLTRETDEWQIEFDEKLNQRFELKPHMLDKTRTAKVSLTNARENDRGEVSFLSLPSIDSPHWIGVAVQETTSLIQDYAIGEMQIILLDNDDPFIHPQIRVLFTNDEQKMIEKELGPLIQRWTNAKETREKWKNRQQ